MARTVLRSHLLLALCALSLDLALCKPDAATLARREVVEATLEKVCGEKTTYGCTEMSRMNYVHNDASASPAARAKTLEEQKASVARSEVCRPEA